MTVESLISFAWTSIVVPQFSQQDILYQCIQYSYTCVVCCVHCAHIFAFFLSTLDGLLICKLLAFPKYSNCVVYITSLSIAICRHSVQLQYGMHSGTRECRSKVIVSRKSFVLSNLTIYEFQGVVSVLNRNLVSLKKLSQVTSCHSV